MPSKSLKERIKILRGRRNIFIEKQEVQIVLQRFPSVFNPHEP